jgi:hypothetical protein
MKGRYAAMTSKPAWAQSDWFDEVNAWILDELALLEIIPTGPIEQRHKRPWSTVFYVPTSDGSVFFKASADVLSHEPALTQTLSLLEPRYLPKILAVNVKKGWMLMGDGGGTLREVIKADRDIRHWEKLLPLYAELQIKVASILPDLLALGTPDRRLATLPEQFDNLLRNKELLLIGQPEGLDAAEYQRLQKMPSEIACLSEQLAASAIPESIHHGDLHDANIFLNNDQYVFFDWGDSSISHPFFSLRTVFVSIEISLGLEEGAAVFDEIRDCYLKLWARYEPYENLLNTFELASRLSPIVSALGYFHVMSSLDEPLSSDYKGAIPGLLQEFLSLEDRLSD